MYKPESPRRGRSNMAKVSTEDSVISSQTLKTSSCVKRKKNVSRMLPENRARFVPKKVEYLIKTVLDAYLYKVQYDPVHCSKLTENICSTIKEKTKEFKFDRCKLVVQVFVGQDNEQSVQLASRSLWNDTTDMFAAGTYRNNSLYAMAIVYGVYLE